MVAVAAMLGLTGCSDTKVEGVYPDRDPVAGDTTPYDYIDRTDNSILGPGGLGFGGGDRTREEDGGGSGVAVNGFLWRASLDTVSFMPVASADPFGGVIITDWHTMPEAPDERFKMNVYILGRSLRADGLRVSVFRQQRLTEGGWVDVPVADDAAARIEDAILARARQLRFAALQQ
jgi:hypothetical protein